MWKTLPSGCELVAAEEAAYAVISPVKLGHITFDLEGVVQPHGTTTSFECFKNSQLETQG